MKPWHVFISILAILLMGFWIMRDTLAHKAWERYHSPAIAIFLDRSDAKLAMIIGNDDFGGSTYDLKNAERAYRKAIAIDPKILWGRYQLARVLFVTGDADSALAEINRELEANPENLRSLYVRGLIYGYRGDPTKAGDDFRRFTAWAPTEWAGYNDLAWALSKGGRYKEALAAIKTALDKVPESEKNPWLWNAKGVAELNLASDDAAATSFAKAQMLADQLTSDLWRRAYPGNDPASAASGLAAFRNAIGENLKRAQVHLAH